MKQVKSNQISSKEIAEFLILNPEFFKENPEVLNSIEIVHETGSAVSLIQKQVEILRSNYNSTSDQLMEFLVVAKNNEKIFSLTKKLILSLIEANNIGEIVSLLEKSFKYDFGAKSSRVLFFAKASKNIPSGRLKSPSDASEILGTLLKQKVIYSGKINKKISSFVFDKKSNIKESVLIPLKCKSLKGLIALSSDEIGKYDKEKDTLFLDFIAEVVSRLVDSHNT